MRKIYRFEVVRELARSGTNAIFEARDPLDGATLQLLEWGGLKMEDKPGLQQAADGLNGPEVFSFEDRAYLAAAAADVRPALEALRSGGLFTGNWPGYHDEPAPLPVGPKPEAAQTTAKPPEVIEPQPEPVPLPGPGPAPKPRTVPRPQPDKDEKKSNASGCVLTAIVLLVAAVIGFVLWSNYQDTIVRERRRQEQERAELNRKIEEERKQKEAAERELKQLRDAEEARKKKEAEEREAAEVQEAERADTAFKQQQQALAAERRPSLTVLTLKNCSAEKIFVAIHYLALNDKWVTTGWWEVAPNATTNAGVWTSNRVLYFYAETPNRGNKWSGEGVPESVDVDVVSNRFSIVRGEPVLGRDKRRVTAFRRTLTFSDQTASQSFSCGGR